VGGTFAAWAGPRTPDSATWSASRRDSGRGVPPNLAHFSLNLPRPASPIHRSHPAPGLLRLVVARQKKRCDQILPSACKNANGRGLNSADTVSLRRRPRAPGPAPSAQLVAAPAQLVRTSVDLAPLPLRRPLSEHPHTSDTSIVGRGGRRAGERAATGPTRQLFSFHATLPREMPSLSITRSMLRGFALMKSSHGCGPSSGLDAHKDSSCPHRSLIELRPRRCERLADLLSFDLSKLEKCTRRLSGRKRRFR